MTASRSSETILADRLRTVLDLVEATAAHQRAQTEAGGAAIETMSVDRGSADGAAASTRDAREAAARSRLAEAAERVRALSEQLDAIDRDLAARETGTRETGTRETGTRETGAREAGRDGDARRQP